MENDLHDIELTADEFEMLALYNRERADLCLARREGSPVVHAIADWRRTRARRFAELAAIADKREMAYALAEGIEA